MNARQFKQYLKQAALLDGTYRTWSILTIDALTELWPILGLAVLCFGALC